MEYYRGNVYNDQALGNYQQAYPDRAIPHVPWKINPTDTDSDWPSVSIYKHTQGASDHWITYALICFIASFALFGLFHYFVAVLSLIWYLIAVLVEAIDDAWYAWKLFCLGVRNTVARPKRRDWLTTEELKPKSLKYLLWYWWLGGRFVRRAWVRCARAGSIKALMSDCWETARGKFIFVIDDGVDEDPQRMEWEPTGRQPDIREPYPLGGLRYNRRVFAAI